MTHATCKDTVGLMLEYLDGELADDVRARLEEHLNGCSPCEEFLAAYRATPSLCKKALAKKMPETVAAKLTEFLRRECKKG